MKRIILASFALAGFVAGPAMAADLGVRAPAYKAPPAPPPILFSWTGCHIGADVGIGWMRDTDNETSTATGAVTSVSPTGTANPSGVKAGGYFGCDYQFSGPIVIGAEGDVEWANIKGGSVNFTGVDSADSYETQSNFQASYRARLGWAFDRVLFYATGGGASARISEIYTCPAVNCGVNTQETFTDTRFGWTVGAGIDWAFTNNLIGRVEYRYADFGTLTNTPLVVWTGANENHRITENAVRFGLAWKFF